MANARVLIVDDEPDLLELVELTLGRMPAGVQAGAQAPAAIPANANPGTPSGAGAPVVPVGQGAAPAATTPFLVTREGLTPTASEEFMAYTWQAGDTFPALAQRYYGSPNHGPPHPRGERRTHRRFARGR